MHVALDCPDGEMCSRSALGSRIERNAVRVYRYELNTETIYRAELLSKTAETRPRTVPRGGVAATHALVEPTATRRPSSPAHVGEDRKRQKRSEENGVCLRKERRLSTKKSKAPRAKTKTRKTKSATRKTRFPAKWSSRLAVRKRKKRSH